MLRGYKYRIYPTRQQIELIEKTFGCCRFVYNLALETKIDRFYPSSKTCSDCGLINDELKLSDREWLCKCGANHDRDVNAAINIKNSGLGKPGGPVELPTVVGAKKQELDRKGERPI